MTDVLLLLARINLAAAAAVVAVLVLRAPVRRLFGARIAYGLWSLAPLAALAMLPPARVVWRVEAAPMRAAGAAWAGPAASHAPATAVRSGLDVPPLLAGVWLLGVLASLGYLAWRQAQFGRALREGRAGPAVIGVLRPRVVIPADFHRRYTAREQAVVLAHEATHIARQDSRINALVAAARCLNWFNPLIHLLAYHLRIDQELACDAQVVAAHPTTRRSYAEAMLKTQLAARPLPLGCHWPAQGAHPLAQRIALLSRATPGRNRRRLGVALVALLGLAGAWSAWAARPAQVMLAPSPAKAWPAATERTAPADGPARPAHLAAGPATRAPAARPRPAAEGPDAAMTPASWETGPAPTSMPDAPPQADFAGQIHAAADRSAVEPGKAVRVAATLTDPDGVKLITDLTAFGSQSRYRDGYIVRNGSRYALFTSVVQQGDRLLVTASLDRRFEPDRSGAAVLSPGEAGRIVLGDGQVVNVVATVRPETPEEIDAGLKAQRKEARKLETRGPDRPFRALRPIFF